MTQQKGEANKYIYNVRQTLNNTLFKDFVMRMASLLEDDETPWRAFDEKTGKLDFSKYRVRFSAITIKWRIWKYLLTLQMKFVMTLRKVRVTGGLNFT